MLFDRGEYDDRISRISQTEFFMVGCMGFIASGFAPWIVDSVRKGDLDWPGLIEILVAHSS